MAGKCPPPLSRNPCCSTHTPLSITLPITLHCWHHAAVPPHPLPITLPITLRCWHHHFAAPFLRPCFSSSYAFCIEPFLAAFFSCSPYPSLPSNVSPRSAISPHLFNIVQRSSLETQDPPFFCQLFSVFHCLCCCQSPFLRHLLQCGSLSSSFSSQDLHTIIEQIGTRFPSSSPLIPPSSFSPSSPTMCSWSALRNVTRSSIGRTLGSIGWRRLDVAMEGGCMFSCSPPVACSLLE